MKILNFNDKEPEIKKKVFIAQGSFLIGDIILEDDTSVWFNTVIRGDMSTIKIGKKTNVQDCSVLHCDPNAPLTIGDNVTIGHRAIVHGCTIEDHVLIGMGAVVMNNAKIGKGSIIAAGATVLENTVIPPYSLAAGSPAKIKKTFDEDIISVIESTADHYVKLKDKYLENLQDKK